jgi:peptidoglycan hydrolase CwlO-like protein
MTTMTRPSIRSALTRDPAADQARIESDIRRRLADAKTKLDGLDRQVDDLRWDSAVTPVEVDRRTAKLDAESDKVKVEVQRLERDLQTAGARRQLANQSAAEHSFGELAEARRRVFAEATAALDRLPAILEVLATENKRLTDLCDEDRSLNTAQAAEIKRGGLTVDQPGVLGGLGIFLIGYPESDIKGSKLVLDACAAYR